MDVLDPAFPLQVKAARSLLGWTQRELAEKAGVSEIFINRLERGERQGRLRQLQKLSTALLEAGVTFNSAADGFGIELKGESALRRRQWMRDKWG
jgi:transcriptional regulator with XRE-family HTH domain